MRYIERKSATITNMLALKIGQLILIDSASKFNVQNFTDPLVDSTKVKTKKREQKTPLHPIGQKNTKIANQQIRIHVQIEERGKWLLHQKHCMADAKVSQLLPILLSFSSYHWVTVSSFSGPEIPQISESQKENQFHLPLQWCCVNVTHYILTTYIVLLREK
uniref:Uncharacterized protein n=1 Tax=Rhizophora mucronata TaxID=61149 RepID=A0A2P2LES3_RHIMU